MNANPIIPVKPCYRCEQPVRMSRSEYADPQQYTTCSVCKAKLAIEAASVGVVPAPEPVPATSGQPEEF